MTNIGLDVWWQFSGGEVSVSLENCLGAHRRSTNEGDDRAEALCVEDVLYGQKCVAHQGSI